MSQYKIIFTGPVGVGKTTAIQSISDVPPIKTDAAAGDMTKARKSETTVAMDYGIMHLDDGEKIHLYGTPGQERFDFMWDILSVGGLGLRIGEFPCRLLPTKNHHFAALRFPDFQRL
jgi:signal recognition particle receptor subunit beta